MSVGALLAAIALVIVIVALVFGAAAPSWLPMALIGLLAVAILTSRVPIAWRGP
jgi:hypothetical protein